MVLLFISIFSPLHLHVTSFFNTFPSSLSIYISFTVHLVGVKTKWIENGGEKIGEKWVICVFVGRGKGGENGGAWHFSPCAHQNSIPSKWRENGEKREADGNYPSTPSPPSHICNVDVYFFFFFFHFKLHIWLYSFYLNFGGIFS